MIFISSRADRYLLTPIAEKLGDAILENDDWVGVFYNKPKYLIVLGDRHETFDAAAQAFRQDIPLVHIHGGERTPYSVDDVHRDCITRMSALHFPPTVEAAERVHQINSSATVIRCGAVGAELATNMVPIPRADLPFPIEGKTWLVTWHPQSGELVEELLEALQEEGGDVIWTYPNADPGHRAIITKIREAKHQFYEELTMPVYLSLMHYVTAVVGNSSSGLIEAPSIGAQTINIGNRQTGRPQASSVTSIACKKADIYAALHLTNYMPVFPKINPYYMPGTIDTIVREIKKTYG